MLHLLVDTSTWLDLSKRRDGQRWIVALRVLAHRGHLELLVPQLLGEEFERNRDRIEASVAAVPVRRFIPMSGRGLIRADRFLRILQPKSSVRPRLAQ